MTDRDSTEYLLACRDVAEAAIIQAQMTEAYDAAAWGTPDCPDFWDEQRIQAKASSEWGLTCLSRLRNLTERETERSEG